MFDTISKYDGYRLNHEHFECVTDTTYVVGAVKELMDDGEVLVNVDDCGDVCVPCFYHCGKEVELTRADSLLGGASAFYECKQEGKDVDAIVVCSKNEPVGVIGFADHKPRGCCFEPWSGTKITNTNPWTIEHLAGTGNASIEMVPEGLHIYASGGDFIKGQLPPDATPSEAMVRLTLPQSFIKWTKLGEWQEIEGIPFKEHAPKTGLFHVDWDVTFNCGGGGSTRPGSAFAFICFGGHYFSVTEGGSPVDIELPIFTSGESPLSYYDQAVIEVYAVGADNNQQGTAPKDRGIIDLLIKYMCIEPTYVKE